MSRILSMIVAAAFLASCNNSGSDTSASNSDSSSNSPAPAAQTLKEENITYSGDGVNMNGYVAYSDSMQGKRPGVLVVHEWWGLNDYPKMRARELAELGYVALAVDMFGDGKNAANPGEAQKLASPFYSNPQMAKARLDAALAKLKTYPQVDTSKIAAIGYCFGGSVVLNAAKLGADLKGVVSFHGGLEGVAPDKNKLKAQVLVCHGEADSFVPPAQVAQFKKQMDSVGADWTFKSYPDATHAFTNPNADENAKKFNMPISYNAEADRNSWNDMKNFFDKIFK